MGRAVLWIKRRLCASCPHGCSFWAVAKRFFEGQALRSSITDVFFVREPGGRCATPCLQLQPSALFGVDNLDPTGVMCAHLQIGALNCVVSDRLSENGGDESSPDAPRKVPNERCNVDISGVGIHKWATTIPCLLSSFIQ
jgi:hypothetical protein